MASALLDGYQFEGFLSACFRIRLSRVSVSRSYPREAVQTDRGFRWVDEIYDWHLSYLGDASREANAWWLHPWRLPLHALPRGLVGKGHSSCDASHRAA
jgi:hypothetical protein